MRNGSRVRGPRPARIAWWSPQATIASTRRSLPAVGVAQVCAGDDPGEVHQSSRARSPPARAVCLARRARRRESASAAAHGAPGRPPGRGRACASARIGSRRSARRPPPRVAFPRSAIAFCSSSAASGEEFETLDEAREKIGATSTAASVDPTPGWPTEPRARSRPPEAHDDQLTQRPDMTTPKESSQPHTKKVGHHTGELLMQLLRPSPEQRIVRTGVVQRRPKAAATARRRRSLRARPPRWSRSHGTRPQGSSGAPQNRAKAGPGEPLGPFGGYLCTTTS
jgi:hypothetical protein